MHFVISTVINYGIRESVFLPFFRRDAKTKKLQMMCILDERSGFI